MNKQSQGSKRKARKKAFLERGKKREDKRLAKERFGQAVTIEELASVMGIKLK